MASPAQASFKLHFIAVVFLLFDSFLQHLSIKMLNYLSNYLSVWQKYVDNHAHTLIL